MAPGTGALGAESSASFPPIPCSYAPLPSGDGRLPSPAAPLPCPRPPAVVLKTLLFAFASVFLVALALVLTAPDASEPRARRPSSVVGAPPPRPPAPVSRGPSRGVSEKSSGLGLGGAATTRFSWTNNMLLWQRTAFHFQPQKNWMNDPNGPLLHRGWYHLFYQYNPDSAVWGNISWGHAVSRDLIHWLYLPVALLPDRWYDANGVWTGSATLLPGGRIAMLYTGSTNASVQVQNLAFPADPSDPLLVRWEKYDAGNPVLLTPPPGISPLDFRDPTTAWYVPAEGRWRVAVGSKDAGNGGLVLVYATEDFVGYELLDGFLHAVPRTGMWECVDFYPVSTEGGNGLNTSVHGPGVKHVLKASLDDDKQDYYAVGTYNTSTGRWTPDDPELDVGLGLRLDYGKYYASKTFYDQDRRRRVLWGWIGETDSELTDLEKGWASLQAVPRTVALDLKTQRNLLQWPVEEVKSLRLGSTEAVDVTVPAGAVLPLDVGTATQLDIEAEFEVGKEVLAAAAAAEADVGYDCSTSGGAAGRGALGPFGLLVLADEDRREQTAVYFYVVRRPDGELDTFVCQDELRSSVATDVVKGIHGSTVPVLGGEKLTVRILVDHSVVETFAQGGRACITSRVYPTQAIYGRASIFLFNNATAGDVTATSLRVWQMNSASIRPYAPEHDAV